VVANSGNANAATGRRGLEDAARMQGAAAMACGVREDTVAVASTGVIGVPLDTDKAITGIARARAGALGGR
jgi:glutamate N-acetyltransferase/amino-acid N-acetyltransferase